MGRRNIPHKSVVLKYSGRSSIDELNIGFASNTVQSDLADDSKVIFQIQSSVDEFGEPRTEGNGAQKSVRIWLNNDRFQRFLRQKERGVQRRIRGRNRDHSAQRRCRRIGRRRRRRRRRRRKRRGGGGRRRRRRRRRIIRMI